MLPTSLAFAWTHWRQHRWGHLGILGYLLTAGVLSAALAPHVAPDVAPAIFGPMTLPLVGVAMYLLVVFGYGFDAHMGGRESCFPAGMFRLPVRTGTLVRWPMAWGAATAALLWLVTAWFILGPWMKLRDAELPLWWPALLAVAALAWIQALLWAPFGLRGLRVVLMVVLIPGMIALAEFSVNSGTSELSLVGLFGCLTLVAWTVGYVGVRYARRGDVPNWEGMFRPLRPLVYWLPRRRPGAPGFRSARGAQVWFEFRRTGSSLPIMTGLVLPFVLLFLLFGVNEVIPTSQTLLSALAVPTFLAGLAGTTVSGKNRWVKDYYGVAPFTATLPMTTGGLMGAKLRAAAWSTLAAWTVVAVATSLAVVLTGHQEEVAGWWRKALDEHHPVKIAAGIVAAATLLVVWTWKRLVDSLFLGLTGRKWAIQVGLLAGMAGFFSLCALGAWVYHHPKTWETFLAMLPWLLGLLILCRLLGAAWLLRLGLRQGLLEEGTVWRWLIAWLLLGSALFGLLAFVVPTEIVPLHYVAFAVLLILPMTRLAAAPLALAWNRHR